MICSKALIKSQLMFSSSHGLVSCETFTRKCFQEPRLYSVTVTCRRFTARWAVPREEPGLAADRKAPAGCPAASRVRGCGFWSTSPAEKRRWNRTPLHLVWEEPAPSPRSDISEALGTVKMHDRQGQNQRGGRGLTPNTHAHRDATPTGTPRPRGRHAHPEATPAEIDSHEVATAPGLRALHFGGA